MSIVECCQGTVNKKKPRHQDLAQSAHFPHPHTNGCVCEMPANAGISQTHPFILLAIADRQSEKGKSTLCEALGDAWQYPIVLHSSCNLLFVRFILNEG